MTGLIPGSKYFSWQEALTLHSWGVQHIPSEEEKTNIIKMAAIMDVVREFLNCPLIVHCWIRPILNNPSSPYDGQDYNAYCKGASQSEHKVGLAVDYNPQTMSCIDGIDLLIPKLEQFGLRMENNGPNPTWIHNDCKDLIPGHSRYFIP